MFTLSGCTSNHPSPDEPVWQPLAERMNGHRQEASCFAIGSKVYFGLGFKSFWPVGANPPENGFLNDFWELDADTQKWKRLADFPGEKRGAYIAFAINNRGYIVFGYSMLCKPGEPTCGYYSNYKDIWEYNPTTDTWKKVAVIDELFDTRSGKAMVINQKAYLLIEFKLFEFDPATYFVTKKAPVDLPFSCGTFSINNRGYAFLGDGGFGNKSVYEYDPLADKWTKKKDFPGEYRSFPVSFTLNGSGYCGGGYQEGNPYQYFTDFWRYDSVADQWSRVEDFPGPGSELFCSGVVNNRAYVASIGQLNALRFGNDFNEFWVFQPR